MKTQEVFLAIVAIVYSHMGQPAQGQTSTSLVETSSPQYETSSPTTTDLLRSIGTSTARTVTTLMPTPSGYKDIPLPLLATTTNGCVNSTTQTREIAAWCLTALLVILSTVLILIVVISATVRNIRNRKRNAQRKDTQAKEDELEENPGYEVSNTRPSLCEVMENPCYNVATEAKRVSETESALYESIKLDHTYINTQR